MKALSIAAAFVFALSVSACNQTSSSQKTADSATSATADTTAKVAAVVPDSDNVDKVYTSYIALKNDLVKTDAKAAKKSAAELENALSAVKGCDEAATFAKKIGATDDIVSQRISFLTLSKDVITLVKGNKAGKETAYVTFCPMANEGKGGYWLSEIKEIKNPYYGSDMLECGEVKEELK
ncbi:hypothetical protein GCM10023149_52930 [Mucilaginibacter gynuensis]|uniref:DUF3347 domain-containing protein n=1 Tax=Mucilaginibacter gynuensis TaxID=1302236 RepID=A0ABP8HLY6_9SPHI